MPPPPTSKPRVRRVDVRDDDAVACRLFTLAEVARMFGKDRKTMDQWIEYGCPTHSMAGPKVIVDLASVLAWRERYVTERAMRAGRGRSPKIAVAAAASEIPDEAGSASGAPSARELSPADLLKLEQIKLTKLKIGQQAEILIPRSLAEAAFERAMGLVKQAVMSVPERISRKMAGAPQDKVLAWREEALGHCRAALAEGAKAVAVAMPSFVAGYGDGIDADAEDAE